MNEHDDLNNFCNVMKKLVAGNKERGSFVIFL